MPAPETLLFPQKFLPIFLQEFTNVCRVRTEVQHGRDKGFSSQLGDKAEKIIKNKFCKSSRESGPKVVFSKRYIYT